MPTIYIIAPWYRGEDYDRIRLVVDDPDHFPETFQEWLDLANEQCAQAAAQGMIAEKVIVEAHGLARFCAEAEIKADAEGRMRYARDLLRRQHPGHG